MATKFFAPEADLARDLRERIVELERWRGEILAGAGVQLAAVGDIHGDYEKLDLLLDHIEREERIGQVVFLGDYFDRKNRNLDVFRKIRKLHESGNGILLLGNHDLWMVQALTGHVDAFATWLTNGGYHTLKEFGIDLPMIDGERGPEQVFERLQRERSAVYKAFERAMATPELRELALWLRKNLRLFHLDNRGFLYIHGGIPLNMALEPDLIYGDAARIESLRRMEQEFRKAETPEAGIYHYLNSPASPLLVRERWFHALRKAGTVEHLLQKVPANGVVFGHTPLKRLLAVEFRVFGVDVMDAASSPGGALAVGPRGIRWMRIQGPRVVSEEVVAPGKLLREIEGWIRSHTQRLREKRPAAPDVIPGEHRRRLEILIESFTVDERRLLLSIVVGCFQHDPVRGREIFLNPEPLNAEEGPTPEDIERYLDLRENDRNLFRAVRMAVISRARVAAAKEAADGLKQKLEGIPVVLSRRRRFYLEQPVTATEESFFSDFTKALDPDERKWVYAWVLALWNLILARLILSLPHPAEEIGLKLTPGLVKSFFELQSAETASLKSSWFTLVPEEGTDRLIAAYQRLRRKVERFGDLLAEFPTQVDPG